MIEKNRGNREESIDMGVWIIKHLFEFRACPIYFCGKICYNVRKGNGCNGGS